MKKPKIALVGDVLFTELGGSIVSTKRFVELLQKKGWDFFYISAKEKISYKDQIIKNGYQTPSWTLPKTQGKGVISLPYFINLKKVLIKNKVDIVHIVHPSLLALKIAKISTDLKIKTIISNHIQPENLIAHFSITNNKYVKKFIELFLRKLYNSCDLIITPTKFGKTLMKKYDVTKPIRLISNGIDTTRFKKIGNKNQYRREEKFSRTDIIFLCVGRISNEKNILILPEALSHLKNNKIKIVHIGSGPEKDKLVNKINEFNLNKRFVLKGFVTDEDLIKYYNLSDFLIHPSNIELEGLVILEAISCGLPILVSNSKENAARFFVKKNGFLFDSKNPEDISKKMLEVIKRKSEFSKKSLELSKEYDMNKSVKKLEDVYYSIVK